MKLKLIIPLLFIPLIVFSQQDPEFSQYNSSLSFFNPASVGSRDKVCLNALQRQQWVGFKGAPSTSYFSADGAFNLFGASHGAGISILNDRYGFNTDLGINFQYAYRIELATGKLGFGLNAGIINKALSPSWIIPSGLGDVTGDPHIPQNKESRVAFDLGLGVFYRSENIFLGLSTTHLNQARIKYANATPYMVRHYYATAGYNLQLSNPAFEVLPYFILKSDGKSNLLYINTTVRYNKKFWGGVSYRIGESLTGMVGVELFNGLRIGYAYDFTLGKISKYNDGSHEFMLGYCFSLKKEKPPQQYKSIRFL